MIEKDFMEVLKEITVKKFNTLTNFEVKFLQARYDYLTDKEKEKLENLLNELKEYDNRNSDIKELQEPLGIDKRSKEYRAYKLKAKEVENAL